jgi:5-methylcytosine-specific restriction protein A
MPTAPRAPCLVPRCPAFATSGGRCLAHAREDDRARPFTAGRRWYYTARWRRLRADVLADAPLCVACLEAGRLTPATDVDHVHRHAGDPAAFWSRANLQPLCHACHSSKTATEDRRP